jgi:hypothetical protein
MFLSINDFKQYWCGTNKPLGSLEFVKHVIRFFYLNYVYENSSVLKSRSFKTLKNLVSAIAREK